MINKLNIWKSNDEWIFKPIEELLVYVENVTKSQVLSTVGDEVTVEKFSQNNGEKMWEISNKGLSKNEKYFILRNFASQKVLTAVSTTTLEIKGTYFKN